MLQHQQRVSGNTLGACSRKYTLHAATSLYTIVISVSSIWANGVNKLVKESKAYDNKQSSISAVHALCMFHTHNYHVCVCSVARHCFKDYLVCKQQKVCETVSCRHSLIFVGLIRRRARRAWRCFTPCMHRCILIQIFWSRPLVR